MISIKHATDGIATVTICPTFTSTISLSFQMPSKKVPSLINYYLEHSEEISRSIHLLAKEIKLEVVHVGHTPPPPALEPEKQEKT